MTVTMQDVAEKAQVSKATISRILNNKPTGIRISAKTQERVLKIIKELNYQPNIFARSLKTKKSQLLGVIIADIKTSLYFGTVLSGVEEAANSKGYYPMICSVDNNLRQEDVYLDILRRNRVSGILLIGAMLELKEGTVRQLVEDNISIVFIGRKIEDPDVSYVSVNNVKGGFLATEHLLKLGHTEIGVILGLPGSIESEERYQGYRSALEKYGIAPDKSLVVSQSREKNAYLYGYRKAMNLFQREKIPTAIFACGDTYAFGAIKAVREKGLRVPEDIAIVGFNDSVAAGYYNPPLTTIRQPMAQMGRAGTNLLIKALENKSDNGKKSLIMEPELIVRESSSPPAYKVGIKRNESSH